jgi:hypothetical protein
MDAIGLSKEEGKPRFPGPDLGFANFAGVRSIGLLVVALGQFCGDGFEVAKEAACAMGGAGGEI